MNFEFSEEQYEFLEQVDRFLEENHDPEVMDPSRENMFIRWVMAHTLRQLLTEDSR